MKYKGKLYGKIGNKYFDTSNTSCDWDVMVSKIKELEEQLSKGQTVPVAGVVESYCLECDEVVADGCNICGTCYQNGAHK